MVGMYEKAHKHSKDVRKLPHLPSRGVIPDILIIHWSRDDAQQLLWHVLSFVYTRLGYVRFTQLHLFNSSLNSVFVISSTSDILIRVIVYESIVN